MSLSLSKSYLVRLFQTKDFVAMPPKDKPSKKAVKEKQNKAIDEATFGIKNKNKSKKVQQFISRVEKSVKRSGPGLEIVSTQLIL